MGTICPTCSADEADSPESTNELDLDPWSCAVSLQIHAKVLEGLV